MEPEAKRVHRDVIPNVRYSKFERSPQQLTDLSPYSMWLSNYKWYSRICPFCARDWSWGTCVGENKARHVRAQQSLLWDHLMVFIQVEAPTMAWIFRRRKWLRHKTRLRILMLKVFPHQPARLIAEMANEYEPLFHY